MTPARQRSRLSASGPLRVSRGFPGCSPGGSRWVRLDLVQLVTAYRTERERPRIIQYDLRTNRSDFGGRPVPRYSPVRSWYASTACGQLISGVPVGTRIARCRVRGGLQPPPCSQLVPSQHRSCDNFNGSLVPSREFEQFLQGSRRIMPSWAFWTSRETREVLFLFRYFPHDRRL